MRAGEELENCIQSSSEQSAHKVFHHGDDKCELSIFKTEYRSYSLDFDIDIGLQHLVCGIEYYSIYM
jgi:hypothetical protein